MGVHLNLDGGTQNLDGGMRPPYNLSAGTTPPEPSQMDPKI